jgi:zinc protease
MPSDIQRARRLNILARVLDNRLLDKLREELGDTYSPQAYHNASDTFPGYGYLAAVVISAPDKTQEIIDIIRATAADTAKGDITQDELDRALRPQLASLKEYVRSNPYWLNRVLMGSVARPAQLDWARTIQSGYENIALPELNALAQQYLPPDHALPVLVQAQPTGK